MQKSPRREKIDALKEQAKQRPKENFSRIEAVPGDPVTNRAVGALHDTPVNDSEETKKQAKALRKRVANHPIYSLLSRAATTGELPHSDELAALNLSQKYRTEIVSAARRVKHEANSPLKAEEERSRSGKVRVTGYTTPAHLAKSMAWDKAEGFISKLPSDHETNEETEERHAGDDSDALADRVWRRTRSGDGSSRTPEPFAKITGDGE